MMTEEEITKELGLERLLELSEQGSLKATELAADKLESLDSKRAFQLHMKAAEQGYPVAMMSVGALYYLDAGLAIERNLDEAKKWLTKAIQAGNGMAHAFMGKICDEEDKPEDAFAHFQQGSDMGDCFSTYLLGSCYEYGLGTDVDLGMAVKLYQAAAKDEFWGGYDAQEQLIYIYMNGIENVVESDEDKAFSYAENLVKHKVAKGYQLLGECYYNGCGTEADVEKAKELFEQAAANGIAESHYYLGEYYEELANYPDLAFAEYKLGAEQDDPVAQNFLAWCYETGYGTVENLAEALKWYHESANNGNAFAQATLALKYLFGEGVEEDETKAFYYADKSARQGYSRGKAIIGLCYLAGYCVIHNEMNVDFGKNMLHELADDEEPDTLACEFLAEYYEANDEAEKAEYYSKRSQSE